MNTEIIANSMASLAELDDDIAQAYAQIGAPAPRHRAQGFETFLSTIVSQQISTGAARAIMGRVVACLPEVSAQGILSVDDQILRQAGLSFRKIEYAKGLADAVVREEFDIDSLSTLSDQDAIQAISSIRGFGRWSAEIYLMFSLGREDIFPADDLALQVALQRLKKVPQRLTPKRARDLVSHWSPWRSVGSLFLWHYYRGAPA
jgi:DNA-3-methyladenine glycosylase II